VRGGHAGEPEISILVLIVTFLVTITHNKQKKENEIMSTTTQKLAGKTAVVTGASKGIGAGIAKRLAAAGASVVVNYSASKGGAEKTVAEITKAGGKAIAVQADLTKKSDIERLFQETKKAYGAVDVLVNNSGIYEGAPIEQVTEDHFHRQFNLNVLGLLLATQEALKIFNPAGGSIINISSVVGINPIPNLTVYSATKGAVDAITKGLAKELGARKIRVNSLNPGLTETEGLHAAGMTDGDFVKDVTSKTPLGRIGSPDDIGAVATFLASDESAWITGETVRAAGGLL
jgi:3-oxoacyl-[acyl-carrier protein] reductase